MKNLNSELIQIIKDDINNLLNSISEKEPKINFIISEFNKGVNVLTIRFSYFVELLNKYSFNYEQSPFKERNFEFLGKRLDLFNETFITRENINLNNQVIYYYSRSPESFNKPIVLFYLLYYRIFIKYLSSSSNISIIFGELYDQWRNSFTTLKIPVTFIIPIPVSSTFIISEKIQIKPIIGHFRIEKMSEEELESSYHFWNFIDEDFPFDNDDYLDLISPCLFYNTSLPYIYYDKYKEEDVLRIRKKFNVKVLNLIQIVNSFYLFGVDFKYKSYFIELPWWFIPSPDKFRNIEEALFSSRGLEEDEKEEFLKLYQNVIKSKIFFSNDYKMISNRYHQIFNRDFYPDLILDAFIIFEWLFTRDMRAELTYRLSLNTALFISSNWIEFKQVNDFMRDLYELRSSIVHGGDWNRKGSKIMKKYNFKAPKDVINKLKSILNKCISRLIEFIINEPNVLKKFEDKYYFFETSRIFKNVEV